MKAKPGEMRRALGRPSPDQRLFLLHGPDEAGAAALVAVLAAAMGADAERVDLEPATLRADPARLADEAAALSLFGGKRWIRVAGAGEESLGAVEALLGAERAGNPVVVLAPALRATARLVKAATDARDALVHACWEPSAADAEKIAAEMLREAGLLPASGVAARVAAAAGGDRAVMAREVEKLALFVDAAPERPRPLDLDAIDAIGADLGEAEAARAILAVVGGDAAAVAAELARLNEAGGSPITWLRALQRRLIDLAEIRAEVAGGQSPDEALKRRRIHFSEQAAIARAVRRWSPAMLAEALDRVRAAERAVTAAANAGPVLADAMALTLARGVARR